MNLSKFLQKPVIDLLPKNRPFKKWWFLLKYEILKAEEDEKIKIHRAANSLYTKASQKKGLLWLKL